MSSPRQDNEEPTSTTEVVNNGASGSGGESASSELRPPAKRRLSSAAAAVIEISDTESDDSDICAVNTYQATADEVKRIRGEDYSSSSSTSSDYSSDSESPWEDDSILLDDIKPHTKAIKAQLNPRANRMDDPKLNSKFKSEEFKETIKSHWMEKTNHSSEEATLTCEPFRVCQLHTLLDNSEIINNIIDDMNTLDWSRRKMDLYEFHQTADLANLTWQRSIRGIYELLKTEIMPWVADVTGLQLTSVSASCSLYGPGDHLLVHDDLRADRRVAFILYLAPWRPSCRQYRGNALENGDREDILDADALSTGWTPQMGGQLQLLAGGAGGAPGDVVASVCPTNNTLAFFQVGPETFHQVSEVLSLELPRLSINGWFHGAAPPAPPVSPPGSPPADNAVSLPTTEKLHNDIVLLNEWLEETYLSPRSRLQVQQEMEAHSSATLCHVWRRDKRDLLCDALAAAEWETAGPPNQRLYEVLKPSYLSSLPAEHILSSFCAVLTSAAWARALTDMTDLRFTARSALCIQRLRTGHYTLLPPREHYQTARLELVLYLAAPRRAFSGGSTVYVAPEDNMDGALATVPPVDNALTLVYCDVGAASFLKYISKMSMPESQCFYRVTCTYHEDGDVYSNV